jgi:hypothetical protein
VLQLFRFARYALRFERAFSSDDWYPVRACFHDHATYVMVGSPPFSGETHGGDNIVALFKRMLDSFDRRFDRRIPRFASWPRIASAGALSFRWRVRYLLGSDGFVLTGLTECRYSASRILHLRDTMDEAGCARAAKFMETF